VKLRGSARTGQLIVPSGRCVAHEPSSLCLRNVLTGLFDRVWWLGWWRNVFVGGSRRNDGTAIAWTANTQPSMRIGRAYETYGPANDRNRCCSRFCPCFVLAAVQWVQPEECKEHEMHLLGTGSGRSVSLDSLAPGEQEDGRSSCCGERGCRGCRMQVRSALTQHTIAHTTQADG
jgi:hypothetical protein